MTSIPLNISAALGLYAAWQLEHTTLVAHPESKIAAFTLIWVLGWYLTFSLSCPMLRCISRVIVVFLLFPVDQHMRGIRVG